MDKPLIIGFYTVNTPYEQEAKTLRLTCEQFGYETYLVGMESRGSWQKNTQMKAEFIQDMLIRFSPCPLLYLDVDAMMMQEPVEINALQDSCDIAAVHFEGGWELLSGTVYFANTLICRAVVGDWIDINREFPDKLPDGKPAWDQRTLEMAIKRNSMCRFHELPQEYTYIAQLTPSRVPDCPPPVILHTRGAYRFKKLINRLGKENEKTALL